MDVVKQRYATVAVDSIRPHPNNPRRGDEDSIGESMDANGFYGAVLVQESTGLILVGAHRWKQAVAKGAVKLPVLKLDVDDATARRIVAVDNRTSDKATYDTQALVEWLASIVEDGSGLAGSGFDEDEFADMRVSLEESDGPTGQGGHSETWMTPSMKDYAAAYEKRGRRLIVLDYSVDAYTAVAHALDGLREQLGVEHNSAAVALHLAVLFPEAGIAEAVAADVEAAAQAAEATDDADEPESVPAAAAAGT